MNIKVKFSGELGFSCDDDWTELEIYEMVEQELRDIRREQLTSVKYDVKIIKYNFPLIQLPVGTKFYVVNGAWEGEICKVRGHKHISAKGGKTPWKNLTLDPDYALDIEII